MKNLKKVLAFTLALAMVLSTMTTTFAADETVDKLSNLGLLLNTSEQEVNAELTRSVGLAMVLKTLGYTQEDSNAKAAENTFVDMGTAEWAKGFAVIGEELKITNGVSVEPKMFAPTQKLGKKAFVTFMLRALGYDTNQAWEKAATLAQETKLVDSQTLEDADFTKGEAAIIMYNALKATVQEDAQKRSLAQKLVDEGKLNKEVAVENGVLEGAAATLEVKSVSATNLRQVNVEFNTKVDVVSAQSKQNYRLKNRLLSEAEVKEDGKTVVLTLDGNTSLENKKETTLTVTGVKTMEGTPIEKTVVNFTPYDDQTPTIKNIRFTGPKNLEIEFSEPVRKGNSNPAITLTNGNRTYSAKVDPEDFNGKTKVDVVAYTTFKNGEEYTIGIGNPKKNDEYFYDYANYPNLYYTQTLTYEKDNTAPEVTVVKASQEEVVVEFNKPVTGVTKDHFYHTFSSYHPIALFTKPGAKASDKYEVTDKNKAVSKLYLQFYKEEEGVREENKVSRPLPEGDVVFNVLGAVGKDKVKDAWGNELQNTSVDLSIVADREAPEVTQVEVTGSKEITVTFNKRVYKFNDAVYTLLNDKGNVVESDSKITATSNDGKVVVLSLTGDYAGKTMVLSIKGIKADNIYKSRMADYSTELEFTDKEWKAPVRAEVRAEGDNVNSRKFFLYVTYGEAMDDSALLVKNYKITDGTSTRALKAHGDGDFFAGQNNVVRFELTYKNDDENTEAYFLVDNAKVASASSITTKENAKVLISQNVKDLAGNMSSAFQTAVAVTKFNTSLSEGVESIEATAQDRVLVKFKQKMENLDGSVFKFSGTHGVASYNVIDDKTLEIFLKDNQKLPFDPSGITVSLDASDRNTDIFGRELSIVTKNLTDKIAPTYVAFARDNAGQESIDSALTNGYQVKGSLADKVAGKPVAYGEYDRTQGKFKVTIVYTKNIESNTVATTSYQFNNGISVKGVTVDNTKVKLEITKDGGIDKDDFDGLTVTQVANIKDEHGNAFAGDGQVLNVYKTKGFVGSARHTNFELAKEANAYKVKLTYQEEIKAVEADAFKLVGGDANKFDVTSALNSGNAKIVEVTISLKNGVSLAQELSLENIQLQLVKELKAKSDDKAVIAKKHTFIESLADGALKGLLVYKRNAENKPLAVLEKDGATNKFKVVLTYVEELKQEALAGKFEKPTANNFAVGDIELGGDKKTVTIKFNYTPGTFATDKNNFKIKQVDGIKLADEQSLPEVNDIVVTVPSSLDNN